MNWQDFHARLFGCSGENWSHTYLIWSDLFADEGIPNDSLIEAIKQIARRDKIPSYANEHLQAIREELANLRNEYRLSRQRLLTSSVQASCSLCRGIGWVIGLPHLEQVIDGEWDPGSFGYQTQAVACSCYIGQQRKTGVDQHWQSQIIHKGKSLMTLDEYTLKNPNYSHQIAKRERARAAENRTRQLAARADTNGIKDRLDSILQRLGAK